MPTFNQAYFIRRAIQSLFKQTFKEWELIIVNDGSTDQTEEFLREYLPAPNIVYIKNDTNMGLGRAINMALDKARYEYIAYLPSDDYFFEDHLASIARRYEEYDDAVLVYTGIKYARNDTMGYRPDTESATVREKFGLQLVQTSHVKTDDRWVERDQWETDDLFVSFWNKLLTKGHFAPTRSVTCFWTQHPKQRHKLISENRGGGINVFRAYYKMIQPLKLRVHKNKFIDEQRLYEDYRKPPVYTSDGIKILLVGELAYNPERIYALEQAGHKLYGLWLQRPALSFYTVGPLPFGHIEDLDHDRWEEEIRRIKPDIIYGLLNFASVKLAYDVMRKTPDIPFVWHYKEGPGVSLNNGDWEKLMCLYANADGKIYLNKYVQEWYEQFIPRRGLSFIMDGDLPKGDYFDRPFSPKLSEKDGAVHTLVTGRMVGLTPGDMKVLADNNIHVHLYSENYLSQREGQNGMFLKAAPKHFHVHKHCSHIDWVEEFSKYDAGWLHCFHSRNKGELMNASWDDLNIPARMSTYAAAGLPVIQRNNFDHTVVMQEVARDKDFGIFFTTVRDLVTQLHDKCLMEAKSDNMKKYRGQFFFDSHVDGLIDFFKQVIKIKNDARF